MSVKLRIAILLAASFLPLSAAEEEKSQIIDLGNGSIIEVKGGTTSIRGGGGGKRDKGDSSGVILERDPNMAPANPIKGRLSYQRDGKRYVRFVLLSADRKASVTDEIGADDPKAQWPPAAPPPVAAGGAWLGVSTVSLPEAVRAQIDIPASQGILIEVIAPKSPAAMAQLKENDILLSLDDKPLTGVEAFQAILASLKPEATVSIGYLRKGKPGTVKVALGTRPPDGGPPGKEVDEEAARLQREK